MIHSHHSSRRRASLLSSLLCCRSDSAVVDPPGDAPTRRPQQPHSDAAASSQLTDAAASLADGPSATDPASLIPVAAGSPAHWEPIDPAHGNRTLVLLSKDNLNHAAELKQVHENWSATPRAGKIVSVHRVQNFILLNAYETMKAQLQLNGALLSSDLTVYHGSGPNAPELIHAGSVGFDPRRSASSSGQCWFARHANYSACGYFSVVASPTVPFGQKSALEGGCMPDPTHTFKQIFQAQITLTKGQDTGQKTFTVDHAARAYPQYLITFQ